MKYLKTFKMIKEAGEWSVDIDWDYVKDHPDEKSEEVLWIKYMWEQLEIIRDDVETFIKDKKLNLEPDSIFKILDIRGYDTYQGPYAKVKIFGRNYEIWNIEKDIFWIKEFPISNQEEENEIPGYRGYVFGISSILFEIIEAGGIDIYLKIKRAKDKYNI